MGSPPFVHHTQTEETPYWVYHNHLMRIARLRWKTQLVYKSLLLSYWTGLAFWSVHRNTAPSSSAPSMKLHPGSLILLFICASGALSERDVICREVEQLLLREGNALTMDSARHCIKLHTVGRCRRWGRCGVSTDPIWTF